MHTFHGLTYTRAPYARRRVPKEPGLKFAVLQKPFARGRSTAAQDVHVLWSGDGGRDPPKQFLLPADLIFLILLYLVVLHTMLDLSSHGSQINHYT